MWRLAFLTTCFSLLLVSQGVAQTRFYVGAAMGTSFFFDQEFNIDGVNIETDYDVPGFMIAGQLGYQFATNIRIETELSYAFTDGEAAVEVLGIQLAEASLDISTLNATAGLYLDLWPIGTVVPYVGGGIGYSIVAVDLADGTSEKDQDVFMLYGEAGVPYGLTPELAVVPAVRFNWIMTEDLHRRPARLSVRDQYQNRDRTFLCVH